MVSSGGGLVCGFVEGVADIDLALGGVEVGLVGGGRFPGLTGLEVVVGTIGVEVAHEGIAIDVAVVHGTHRTIKNYRIMDN